MSLSSKEEIIFQAIITQYNTSPLIQILVKKFYIHHKKINDKQSYANSQIEDYLKCSLLVAQKSNFTYTLSGKTITGFIFSFNQILKTKNCSQKLKFLNILEQFINIIQLKNVIVKEQMVLLIKETSINLKNSILFRKGFEVFLSKNEKNFDLNQKLLRFGWMLYLDAKQLIYEQFTNKIMDLKYLMASVTYIIVKNALQNQNLLNIEVDYLKPFLNQTKDDKLIISFILKSLFFHYEIKGQQVEVFKNVSEAFDFYFDSLIMNEIICYQLIGQSIRFITQELVENNYYLIQKKYLKTVQFNEIDLRNFMNLDDQNLPQNYYFVKQKINKCCKFKFNQKSSYQKKSQNQKEQLKLQVQPKQSSLKSHQVLNLQTHKIQSLLFQNQQKCEKLLKNQQCINNYKYKTKNKCNISQLFQEQNLPQNVVLQKTSHLSFKQRKEIQKYILKNSKPYLKSQKQYDEFILKMIQKCLYNIKQQERVSLLDVNQVKYLIYQLFRANMDSLIGNKVNQIANYLLNQTSTMYKSILVSALDIVLLKYKLSKKSFQTVISIIMPKQTQVLYVYVCLNQLKMPESIKSHIKMRINQMLISYIWKDLQFLQQLQNLNQDFQSKEIQEQSIQNDELICIFNMLKNHIVQLTQQLYFEVNFERNSQKLQKLLILSIQIFMKTILCFPKILHQRNVFQILICCNYLSSKICETKIKFIQLIEIYNQTFFKQQQNSKQIKNNLFYQIKAGNHTVNIISFYNNDFLQKARSSLLLKNSQIYQKLNLQDIYIVHPLNDFKQNLVISPCNLFEDKDLSQNYIVSQNNYIVSQNNQEYLPQSCQIVIIIER